MAPQTLHIQTRNYFVLIVKTNLIVDDSNMTILSYQEDSQTWLSYRDWSSLLTQSHLLPSLLGKCQVSPVVWTCTRRSNLLTLYKNKIGWIIVPLYKTGECDNVRAVIIGLHAFNHQWDKFCLQWYLEKLSCTKQQTENYEFHFY